MKQIEVKFDAKAKDVLANTLDLGGSSMIEVKVPSKITLDGPKLLQLLISKNVDVDAEVTGGGILLGGAIAFGDFLYDSVNANILTQWSDQENTYVQWTLCSGMYANKPIGLQTTITFASMLANLGTIDLDIIYVDVRLIPYVAVQTSSVASAQPISITNDEFLSFITITPANEQTEE